jgi:hypothetical protein
VLSLRGLRRLRGDEEFCARFEARALREFLAALYDGAMRGIVDTLGGLWELLLLAWKTRFRLRGAYWRWRYETAFGRDPAHMPSRRERIRAMLDYGRWVYRIKRGR